MTGLFTRNRVIGLALAAFIAVIDQVSKWWSPARSAARGRHISICCRSSISPIPKPRHLARHVAGDQSGNALAAGAADAAIALVVLVWMLREKRWATSLGLALILGGALGNIRDRYMLGYVVDFADFHIGDFRPFLIFNIADAAITIGVVIILARSLLVRDKDETETPAGCAPWRA
jgi:signal peptidase II